MTFVQYLFSITALLAQSLLDTSVTVTIVLGNEAADLDSMVSSLALAYHMHSSPETLVIPVINIPRSEYKLKTECIHVFEGILGNDLATNLVFRDEIDLGVYEDLRIVLVDHNELVVGLEVYAGRVVRIVDHHEDKRMYDSAQRRVEACGSCVSLIVDEIGSVDDVDLAKIMLVAIHVDTNGLSLENGKTTKADLDAAKTLDASIESASEVEFDVKSLHQSTKRVKTDLSGFGMGELLRRDFKMYTMGGVRVGISSLLVRMRWLVDEFGGDVVEDEIGVFMKEKGIEFMVLLTHLKKTHCCFVGEKVDQLMEELVDKLELEESKIRVGELAVYHIVASLSRKKLHPILDTLFNT